MMLKSSLLGATFIIASFMMVGAAQAQVKIDSHTFGDIEARAIGPAVMGGRIAALDAVMEDRLIIYVGAAGGGRLEVNERRDDLQAGL